MLLSVAPLAWLRVLHFAALRVTTVPQPPAAVGSLLPEQKAAGRPWESTALLPGRAEALFIYGHCWRVVLLQELESAASSRSLLR